MYEIVAMRNSQEFADSSGVGTTDFEESTMQYYRSKKSPAPEFTPAIWKDVGASLCRALLDYDCKNPVSRLVQSKEKTPQQQLQRVRKKLK